MLIGLVDRSVCLLFISPLNLSALPVLFSDVDIVKYKQSSITFVVILYDQLS